MAGRLSYPKAATTAVDDAAILGVGDRLELPGGRICSDDALISIDDIFWESRRTQELALFGGRGSSRPSSC